MSKASEIIDKMFLNDPFSQWLGVERIEEEPGSVVLQLIVKEEMLNGFGIAHGGITYSLADSALIVKEEMLNGFGIAHGGITYSLADSALAFSANGHGIQSVSIETSISHTKAVKLGDVLRTKVTEENLTKKIGIYSISILNQENEKVALFKGTVFRTGKEWEI